MLSKISAREDVAKTKLKDHIFLLIGIIPSSEVNDVRAPANMAKHNAHSNQRFNLSSQFVWTINVIPVWTPKNTWTTDRRQPNTPSGSNGWDSYSTFAADRWYKCGSPKISRSMCPVAPPMQFGLKSKLCFPPGPKYPLEIWKKKHWMTRRDFNVNDKWFLGEIRKNKIIIKYGLFYRMSSNY